MIGTTMAGTKIEEVLPFFSTISILDAVVGSGSCVSVGPMLDGVVLDDVVVDIVVLVVVVLEVAGSVLELVGNNCSGGDAAKASLLGISQFSSPLPQQHFHRPEVAL